MSKENQIKHESGVRKYLNRSALQLIRQWWNCRKIAHIGLGTYVERNVIFQRFPENIFIGSQVIIKEGARICSAQPNALIEIGDWTTIGYNTFIFASIGIKIGAECLISPFCYFVDSNHSIERSTSIRRQLMSASPIKIGNDVWLGVGVKVLRGVTIHDGAVVGANSVVTEDLPPYSISNGIPAKVIDLRK